MQLEFHSFGNIFHNCVALPKCTSAEITGSVTFTTMTNSILLNTLRGDLGQWEYLKGFFNMFNLVVLQDKNNPNNLIIEPYNDIFIKNTSGTSLASRNILYDWTDKIDVTEIIVDHYKSLR